MQEELAQNNFKYTVPIMLIMSFLGFIDATYLTVQKILGLSLRCGAEGGCNLVAQSPYSSIGPIPLSLIGLITYLIIFFGALSYHQFKNNKILKLVSVIIIIEFAFSLYLLGLQAFVIKAFCQYCLLSLAFSTVLFINAVVILKKLRSEH